MKRRLKQIKGAASALMTIASVAVLIMSLGMVDMELSLLPIIAFFAALAWIVHAIKGVCKGGVESVGQDADLPQP